MDLEETTKPINDQTPARNGSYFPGPSYWIIWALCALGIAVVRSLEIDLAGINIVTIVLAGIAFFMLGVWWIFRSAYPAAIRWLPPVLLIVAASVFLVRYRVYRFTGSLIPQFVPKGEQVGDQLLTVNPLADDEIVVDLSTTTLGDFPKFLGPNGNSQITTTRINTDWKAHPPKELWRSEIGAGWSAFAAVNGFAVTLEQRGEFELVTCREVDTGTICWTHSIDTRHETALGFVGPRSTPTIVDGIVYAMGAAGHLRCLNGTDGSERWVRDLYADYGISPDDGGGVIWGRSNSPLIVDDKVVMPVGGPQGGKAVSLVALNRETGETLWEAGSHTPSYATPVVAELLGVRQIISINQDFVTGHDIDSGDELWEHPWPGSSGGNANVSQPHVVGDDQLFLSKGYGTGAQLLQFDRSGDDWISETLWETNRVMKTKFSNVAIKDGLVYGLDQGVLCCADLETGDRVWRKGKYSYGQILLVGDVIMVISESGELILVKASGEGHEELARFQAIEGQTWNNVCLYGNRLLVRNSEEAACFELKLDSEPKPEPVLESEPEAAQK